MGRNFFRQFYKDNKAYSLIELLVVIAIMVILVAVITPMLFNGPSWNTREDVKTFDAMLSKNAMNSMSKEHQALEMGYDTASGQYYVDVGTFDDSSNTFTGTRKYLFHKDENIRYYLYSDSEGSASFVSDSSGRQYRTVDSSAHTVGTGTKIYFFFDKARGNFDEAKIFTGGSETDAYVKYVYFTIDTKTKGIRLYKDTGKHEIFK